MKKKRLLIIVGVLLCLSVLSFFTIRNFIKKSYAVGNVYVSPASLTIEEGTTQSFTIRSENVIGDVTIESSNSGVASVSQNEWSTGMVGENETKSGTITVTGVSVGTATITMTIDGATFDEEDLSGQVRTVTVNVIPKQVQNNDNNNSAGGNNNANNSGNSNTNTNTNTNTSTNTNVKNTANNNNNNSQDNNTEKKSDNNKIKELSVDSYKIRKINDSNYSLDVSREVEKINIKVVCEDDKATVTGTGEKSLKDGENKFEIVVTSESGKTNKIYLTVKKISIYELKDLDTALNDKSDEDINIKIDNNSSITSKDLLKIKESGKTINLVNDKNTKYSFVIDGKRLSNIDDNFSTEISFTSEFEDKILKLSNNAEGEFLHFGQKNQFPEGVMLKLYVTDKFSDSDKINVYYYDNNGNKLVEKDKNLSIDDGYVQFKLSNVNDHFVTNATIEKSKGSLPIILFIIIIILIIVIVSLIIKGKKKSNNNDDSIKSIVNDQEKNVINENVNNIANPEISSDSLNNNGEELNGINNNVVDNSSSVGDLNNNGLGELNTDQVKTETIDDLENNDEPVSTEVNELNDVVSNQVENNNDAVTNNFDNIDDKIIEDIKSVAPDNNLVDNTSKTETIEDNKKTEPVITAVTEEYSTSSEENNTNDSGSGEELL